MAHVYEVKHSNGRTYDVTTNRHHSEHSEDEFARHLLDIVKGAAGGVLSGYIVHFALKRH